MRALTFAVVVAVAAAAGVAAITVNPLIGLAAGGVLVAGAGLLGLPMERLAWIGACLLAFTITWNGLRLAGGSFANVFMLLAFGAMVAHKLLERRPVSAPPTLLMAAVGFWLATCLVLIFPPDFRLLNLTEIQLRGSVGAPLILGKRSDLFTLIEVELSLLIVPLVMIAAASTPKRLRILLDLWTAGLIVNSLIGFMDTLGIAHLAATPLSGASRSVGLTIHPNYLALGACMGIPTAMLWLGRSRLWSWAGLFALGALLGGVYASGSRAGAIACVFAVVVTSIAVPRLRRFMIPALPVVGMVAIVVLMFTSTGDRILDQVRLGGDTSTEVNISGSDFERSRAADVAFDQFSARPLQGVGFSVITDAHSIYLQLLAAGGIIALVSFFIFIGGLAGSVMRSLNGPLRDEALATGIVITVWLCNGVVDNQVGDKYLFVIPGLIYAIARLSWAPAPREVPARPRPAPVRRPVPV
ncbi:MAG TPA: O-antigen ligase family protein [Solirubrobacteraceae bacterium]